MHLIGIRREDKNAFERRTPLVPDHVRQLQAEGRVKVAIQPSVRRIFPDGEYLHAGAAIDEGLHACPVILGIKEIPIARFLPLRTYLFFSHTIKGQPYNMAMLRRIMELRCTLIDYERITDDSGRRLIFFGRYAGLAGMVETLWALGQRLLVEGFATPLCELRQTYTYSSLDEAKAEVARVGKALRGSPLPEPFRPLCFGITGYGNVSLGAQEILNLLDVTTVEPAGLAEAAHDPRRGPFIMTVFHEEHLAERLDGAFDVQHYYRHPEAHRSLFFDRHLPHLHALVNCIYWEPRFPRLVSLEQLHQMFAGPQPRLRVVGDISCDPDGSVQATVRVTDPEHPVYVYDLDRDEAVEGFRGRGPVIMAVENLPAELPREASHAFSAALLPFIPDLAACDFTQPWERLALPKVLQRATIVHQGKLTPTYTYLEKFLNNDK